MQRQQNKGADINDYRIGRAGVGTGHRQAMVRAAGSLPERDRWSLPCPHSTDKAAGMAKGILARHVAFVLRCSLAATLSYLLASWLGLPHAMWASISAIIVSQERLNDTKQATLGRLAGTLIGIAVAVTASSALHVFGVEPVTEMALGVATCALIARGFPSLRVCMWTVPIVFLAKPTQAAMLNTALWRSAEVIMGGLVGAMFHWLAEAAINQLGAQAARATSVTQPGDTAPRQGN